MYVCVYIHMYVCAYVCMYVCMYDASMSASMYVYMYVRMHVCTYMDPPYREVVFRVRVVGDVHAKLCASPPWFLASDPGPCPPPPPPPHPPLLSSPWPRRVPCPLSRDLLGLFSVFICMYVYMYVYMYTCVYVNTSVFVCLYRRT